MKMLTLADSHREPGPKDVKARLALHRWQHFSIIASCLSGIVVSNSKNVEKNTDFGI